ncbi:MAG: hypothetical protein LBR73_00085 [Oscillospiraceae bacterium]|jgi:hypothetical protein|nr:hypothetical protein [Oscillospiraceae bacterium]
MRLKKVLCVLLAVLSLTAVLPLCVSADTNLKEADVSKYPIIHFTGNMHALFINEGKTIFNPASMGTEMTKREADLNAAISALDLNKALDIAIEIFWAVLGPVQMNEDGDSINKNITCKHGTVANGVKWIGRYFFNFDWRLDPVENADILAKYVDEICKKEGKDKVNMYAVSGSGSILLAYLAKYGTSKVASVVENITMQNGTSFFGALATRDMTLNTEVLGHAKEVNGKSMADYSDLLQGLYNTGLLDILERIAKIMSPVAVNKLYEEAIIPLIFQMPAFWSYVPIKDYELAKAKLGFSKTNKYAKLVAKMDHYFYDIVAKQNQILDDVYSKMKFAVRAGYGRYNYPIGHNAFVTTDTTVDTKYATFGATCALPEHPFSPLHIQLDLSCGHNHVSPDHMVDASTCRYKEVTWIALNQRHQSEYSYSGWYEWWLQAKNPTVNSNPVFPQFSVWVAANKQRTGWDTFVTQDESYAPNYFVEFFEGVWGLLLGVWRYVWKLPTIWLDLIF